MAALPWLIMALRRKKLRLWHLGLAGLLVLAALIYSYAQGGSPGSPQRAARNFLSAIADYDCDKAWRYFSSDSQQAIQIASEKYKNDPRHRDTMRYMPQRLQTRYRAYLEPKNLYCLPTVAPVFDGYRSSSVKLVKVEGTTATVAVKKGIPTNFLIPGFFPTSTKYEDHELQLVREGKEWKISFQPSIGP